MSANALLRQAALFNLVVIVTTAALVIYTGFLPLIANGAVWVVGFTAASALDWRQARRRPVRDVD